MDIIVFYFEILWNFMLYNGILICFKSNSYYKSCLLEQSILTPLVAKQCFLDGEYLVFLFSNFIL